MEIFSNGVELQPFHVCVHANLPGYVFVRRKKSNSPFRGKFLKWKEETDNMNANWNAMIEIHGTICLPGGRWSGIFSLVRFNIHPRFPLCEMISLVLYF